MCWSSLHGPAVAGLAVSATGDTGQPRLIDRDLALAATGDVPGPAAAPPGGTPGVGGALKRMASDHLVSLCGLVGRCSARLRRMWMG